MDFPGNPRRQTSDAFIGYNNIVNKHTLVDNGHMVTHQSTDSLNIQNINQRNIHRASQPGLKP